MNRIDRLTDDMADQVKGFRGHRKRIFRSVKDLFDQFRSGKAANAPNDESGREVRQTMQSAFVQKIQMLTETAGINLSYTT